MVCCIAAMVSDGCRAGKRRPATMVHHLTHRPGRVGSRMVDAEVAAAAFRSPERCLGHEPGDERRRTAAARVGGGGELHGELVELGSVTPHAEESIGALP